MLRTEVFLFDYLVRPKTASSSSVLPTTPRFTALSTMHGMISSFTLRITATGKLSSLTISAGMLMPTVAMQAIITKAPPPFPKDLTPTVTEL